MLPQKFRSFDDGETVTALGYDIVIRRRNVGKLAVPTGELVACDPLHYLETEPFAVDLEPGYHPLILIIAELRDENRIAYAMLETKRSEAVRWEKAGLHDDDDDNLLHLDAGFPVDSSIGCFVDARTAGILMDYRQAVMPDEDEFERAIHSQMNRYRKKGYSWANVNLESHVKIPGCGRLNLIAFETGYGPGLYETWIGRDEEGDICRIVTDFDVLDLRFNTFKWW